jgi:hypothetical protein
MKGSNFYFHRKYDQRRNKLTMAVAIVAGIWIMSFLFLMCVGNADAQTKSNLQYALEYQEQAINSGTLQYLMLRADWMELTTQANFEAMLALTAPDDSSDEVEKHAKLAKLLWGKADALQEQINMLKSELDQMIQEYQRIKSKLNQ